MRILFCNIAWMKYYNGITHDDKPVNGGSWVKENENAIECLNFTPYNDRIYCGYVSTKSNRGNRNQLHIEKLEGITKEDNIAEDVLVIWVAKRNINEKNKDDVRTYRGPHPLSCGMCIPWLRRTSEGGSKLQPRGV